MNRKVLRIDYLNIFKWETKKKEVEVWINEEANQTD